MPVYNENAVADVVRQVLDACGRSGMDFSVMLCDDGSNERTRVVEQAISSLEHVQIRFSHPNRGKGAILNEAFPLVDTEWCVVVDADREYLPADIIRLLEPLAHDKADWTMGSRYGFGRPRPPQYLLAYLVNRLVTVLFSRLSGVGMQDVLTGLYAFKTECVRGVVLKERRFAYTPELLWKVMALGKPRFLDVPVSYGFRTYGEGKTIRWWETFTILWATFRYRRRG